MVKPIEAKYKKTIYATGFKIKCIPENQSANAMNYLITGYPLNGKSLDGVIVEFLGGEFIGKKAIFETNLYELIEKQ